MIAAWAIAKALPWKLIAIGATALALLLGIWYYGSVKYAEGEAAERHVWERKVQAERDRLELARVANAALEAKRALEAITSMPLIDTNRAEVNADAVKLPKADTVVIPPGIARRLFLDANGNGARPSR